MTDSEVFAFMDVFRGLERVFPKRLEEHERQRLGADYFRTLRKFPLPQVAAGAEVWLQRGKYFPKPAEWLDAIPRQRAVVAELPAIAARELADLRRAESLGYEDVPCACAECRAADVTEKPIRFVPDITADGTERKALDGERTVTLGHWAHGYELARWYQARADFWERCHALGLTSVAKELKKQQRQAVNR